MFTSGFNYSHEYTVQRFQYKMFHNIRVPPTFISHLYQEMFRDTSLVYFRFQLVRNTQFKGYNIKCSTTLEYLPPLSPTYTKKCLEVHRFFTSGFNYSHRSVGRGGSRGSLEPPFWPPKDYIYTAIVHFKFPTGPPVSLLLRITAVQASLVACTRVCS